MCWYVSKVQQQTFKQKYLQKKGVKYTKICDENSDESIKSVKV